MPASNAMKNRVFAGVLSALILSLAACDKSNPSTPAPEPPPFVSLEDVARLLASVPLENEQMGEVHDAASASAGNGYDEEYRMQDLFTAPGSGVGDAGGTKAAHYARPLRDLLREAALATKASEEDPEVWLDSLSVSDVQIYWPFSDSWDGSSLPVVTYDPGDGAAENEGYAFQADGTVQKVLVDEKMASERPVWVVNRNSDADYKSLELRRREDPSWGTGGGDILVKSAAVADYTPAEYHTEKVKKKDGEMALPLKRTADILREVGAMKQAGQLICGFSMETENLEENSRKKLQEKNLDLVVANNLKVEGAGFGVDTNVVTLISRQETEQLPILSKEEVAHRILDQLLKQRKAL